MADTPSGTKPGGPKPPEEPSMEKRLLLAFLLMGGVLFLMPYLYKSFGPQEPPPRPVQTAGSRPADKAAPVAPVKPSPAARVAGAKPAAPRVSADKEQTFALETDLYKIELANRGAVVRSWILRDNKDKKYRDSAGDPLELVGKAGALKTGYPFGVPRISLMTGAVSVRHGDSGDWVAAAVNSPLAVNDNVLTGPGARAEIQLDYANVLRLSSDSEARILQQQNWRYRVQVARGTATLSVIRDSDAQTELDTPNKAVWPAGRGVYRVGVGSESQSEVTVREGAIVVNTPSGDERVPAGSTLVVRGAAAAPTDQQAPAADPDDWDRWNADRDASPAADLNQALWSVKPAADGLGFDCEYSDGEVVARKTFRFQRNSYLSEFTSEVTVGGAAVAHFIEWRGAFGDFAVQNAAGAQSTVHYDLAAGKLVVRTVKDAKTGYVTEWGSFSFAGVEDKYFAAVFLPRADGPVAVTTSSDDVTGVMHSGDAGVIHAGVAVGGSGANRFSLFVGPKDLDILKKVSPKLEQMVDFGTWFGWLAKPLFLIVNWLDHNVAHNYGWAIVLITVLINFALLPLKFTSMKSMKKMQALKPQLDAINAKYKNVGMRDPKKAEQNQEVMELYKKNGVNPMGGCLPMLIQLPFFIAFYSVLGIAIEMRGASWLWVTDLSQPEHLPIHILPILMIVAQFVSQKMTPTPGQDPTQAKMMLFLPLVFGFMFYSAASGLVLYWLTTNLVGIGQQWFINRSMPAPPEAAPLPAPKRKKGGSKG